jgi:hypothetical protein
MNPQNRTIAVIGLGYVGPPLGAGEIGGKLPQCKRITAQRSFAVLFGLPRRACGTPRIDGIKYAAAGNDQLKK